MLTHRIAWATGASNGHIHQWSRWHLTRSLTDGTRTLCGLEVPHTKWITPETDAGDYRIKGGECVECKKRKQKRLVGRPSEDENSGGGWK